MAKKKPRRSRRAWLDAAEYLPEVMRDFHDQKDIFKAVYRWAYVEGGDKEPCSWVDAHIYTVDVFLTYMACHGYTLQRCRANIEFSDLGESIREDKQKVAESFRAAMFPTPRKGARDE